MATIWSFYFQEQTKRISRVDANGYTWTLALPKAGVLEVQTDSPVEIAKRVWRFGVKGMQSRSDDVVLPAAVNDPAIQADGSIVDGDGMITVSAPQTETTGA
jgi:hypothetical protein